MREATKQAVFRTDASVESGIGHVMRCLTLADALAAEGWTCGFACRREAFRTVPALARSDHERLILDGARADEPALLARFRPRGCRLLVVDHYGLGADFETACRSWARHIMAIDDLANRRHDCDTLLDCTPGRVASHYADLVPGRCRMLLGADHALLRPEFTAARPAALDRRRRQEGVGHILVAMGGTDRNDLTGRVLDGIEATQTDARIYVVLGAAAPHRLAIERKAAAMQHQVSVHIDVTDMAALMAAADLALGTAGTTSWERCCLGLPAIVVTAADNQAWIAAVLRSAGAAVTPDRDRIPSTGWITRQLTRLAGDATRRANMSAAAAALCDGRGLKRVVATLPTLGDGDTTAEARVVAGHG